MKPSQLLSAALLAFAPASVVAISQAFSEGGNLPADHIMYAEPEMPVLARRAPSPAAAAADAACTNSPTSRNCWSSGYSVATDFDQKFPTTGVTKSYSLAITNVTNCKLDGMVKPFCLYFNGVYPGPVIRANWGDMLSITVTNNMVNNGTSIHWHGIRQLGTNNMDGVNGITECPLAPGETTTYTFQATQFGTSWYHSHHSSQYGNGLVGPIIIDGPTSDNWDVDLGSFPVSDYYYQSAENIDADTMAELQVGAPGPEPDNILVNGTNMNVARTKGAFAKVKLTKGKKHLLRLINTSVDNPIRVSLDSHPMEIVANDFIPVRPLYQDSILIAIGQRYEVIINANQTAGSYWFRAVTEGACRATNANNNGGNAIFFYSGTSAKTPTTAATYTDTGCTEPSPLTPWVANTVGSESLFISQAADLELNLDIDVTTSGVIVYWGLNFTSMDVSWTDPTLSYIQSGNTTYPSTMNLIEVVNEGVWTFWIIQETNGLDTDVVLPHPIHLHGHDFYVLGRGTGVFNMTTDPATLSYDNPTRRDTAILPGGGWMVVAFPADNPGAWLMHCHIAWHISEGLGVQFLESPSTMPVAQPTAWNTQCSNWGTFSQTALFPQIGSGI